MIDIRVKRKQGEFVVDTAFVSEGVGVTALFGDSGAGKTSVINMVAGLISPDEGRIEVNGSLLFDSEKRVHVPPEKRRIGYVFQDGRLFPHLSVRSNLRYGMRLTPGAEHHVPFDEVVRLLGIEHVLGRRPAKLSGGEKQRVAIGRALLTNPSLLLMHEPLASLDGARKAEILPFIARLSKEFSLCHPLTGRDRAPGRYSGAHRVGARRGRGENRRSDESSRPEAVQGLFPLRIDPVLTCLICLRAKSRRANRATMK